MCRGLCPQAKPPHGHIGDPSLPLSPSQAPPQPHWGLIPEPLGPVRDLSLPLSPSQATLRPSWGLVPKQLLGQVGDSSLSLSPSPTVPCTCQGCAGGFVPKPSHSLAILGTCPCPCPQAEPPLGHIGDLSPSSSLARLGTHPCPCPQALQCPACVRDVLGALSPSRANPWPCWGLIPALVPKPHSHFAGSSEAQRVAAAPLDPPKPPFHSPPPPPGPGHWGKSETGGVSLSSGAAVWAVYAQQDGSRSRIVSGGAAAAGWSGASGRSHQAPLPPPAFPAPKKAKFNPKSGSCRRWGRPALL
ncbi:vegetative cell wall protein gp1-like isoform X2 [Tyto alba]|uniref:vegetative cell wall protein gp1-like isoform X1 n=1 Tax=Tyto alba TaxID=56313 RepID=UPI001C67FE19|nr:vegetative cell wall protein gp1-like isoform X1 [Tyto alba]XP_042658782.1 vegetative cell wall protein gp1-like isoform X2 [Tyto alba]